MGDAEVTASSWRQVEQGRIAFFANGPYINRVAAIVQIIDHKRVLVEGPSDEPNLAVPRHAAALKDLSLTGIVIEKLPLATGSGALKKKWAETKIDEKWTNSGYAKRLQKEARRKQLNDFERFKVMRLRKQARFEVRKAIASAKA
ncbi:hypothetical protein DOTSEDRAFT_68390 [Dothistroma septosporum NZE10]|uniref:Large ribosomal subunit protein eL14 domain-containing protein n=1 Tax=Dothistroma septosporum (strain NZE10 / CBS 128990) TaxID=675120 RepID=N1Q1M5_DOTSN|nr:hypothetical protein DOTSEDRAFT_68390 [Dothistroma septosporum NZE10]